MERKEEWDQGQTIRTESTIAQTARPFQKKGLEVLNGGEGNFLNSFEIFLAFSTKCPRSPSLRHQCDCRSCSVTVWEVPATLLVCSADHDGLIIHLPVGSCVEAELPGSTSNLSRLCVGGKQASQRVAACTNRRLLHPRSAFQTCVR